MAEDMISIEAVADFDKKFANALKAASKNVQDLRVPLNLIRASWFRSNNAIFALSGPGQYQDLSEKYKVLKRKEVGFIYPILRRSGNLERSITDPSNENAIGKVLQDRQTLLVGTRVPYGVYHQSSKPRRVMPRRPFLFASAEQTAPSQINERVASWTTIIEDWVAQVTANVGDKK